MQWRDGQGHVDCYQLHQGKRVVDDEEGHHQNKEDMMMIKMSTRPEERGPTMGKTRRLVQEKLSRL